MTSDLMTARPEADAPPAQNPHHDRRWLILAVLGVAQLMVVLDATIVNIALPTAQRALSFSNADRQWIVTGYALSLSVATVGLTTDAGIASAMVNTTQQVGGSVGTSLFNTLAASAVTAYALANHATATSVATLQAQATVHGYRVVFTYAAVFLATGAVIAGLLLRRGSMASLAREPNNAGGTTEAKPELIAA